MKKYHFDFSGIKEALPIVTLTLTQAYDENLRMDFETILDKRTVPPSEVANVLAEYSAHPNNYDRGDLVVTAVSPTDIRVMLYNGYIE